jgi:hypothetical protein
MNQEKPMNARPIGLVVAALALGGCGGTSAATDSAGSVPSAASTPAGSTGAAAPASTSGSPTAGTCAAVDDAVTAIIGPVANPTDKTAADFEICTWIGGSDGRGVATFIATLAPASRYDQLAHAVGARGYGKATPVTGFDRAGGWTDQSMGTFVLLASAGSRAVQLEGSAASVPGTATLTAIAHTLIG